MLTLPRPAHLLATKGPATGSQRVPLPSCSRLYVMSSVRPFSFLGCASTRAALYEQDTLTVQCAVDCQQAPHLHCQFQEAAQLPPRRLVQRALPALNAAFAGLFNGACSLTGGQRMSTYISTSVAGGAP